MKIILASASPRRKQILKMLNIDFDIIIGNVEEKLDEKMDHYTECMKTAKLKAESVFMQEEGDVIVIGSDTIVSRGKKIYGKPKGREDAFKMLKSLSGKSHEVISSICLMVRKNGITYSELDYDKCEVSVCKMSDDEINDWLNKSDYSSYAGAYAIQEGYAKYIEKIEGDYYSIVGLPLHKLYKLLKKYI